MTISGQSGEAGCDQRSLVDRRVVAFLEVAQQPSRGDARMPARILARDQDDERVFALDRSTEGFAPPASVPLLAALP
jgi:hypothetical protein